MGNNDLSHKQLVESLHELAMDLHWTWNHATDKIWRQLHPSLWELTHNPLVVLQTVSHDRIHEVLHDPLVKEIIQELIELKRERAVTPAWFQKTFPETKLTRIAFFSMEFMLSEALPIYSGGLGNVSGDLLKTASDLGVPVVGVGLFYQQGYPRQVIYSDGTQQYVSPFNDPGQLPISPIRNTNGEMLRIELKMPGYSVWLRTWMIQVGRVSLLLLDSNDAANLPIHRGLTSELYGGDAEMRLVQELILGIGGWRLLQMMGMQPEVCHLNEGHTAFAVVERAKCFMKEHKVSFEVALNATRAGNIFTTHTAVGAGFDRFPPAMIKKYLAHYVDGIPGITMDQFLELGRKNPADQSEPFNVGFLALKGSTHVNGVSRLHQKISRRLFAGLFPRWPLEEVPVSFVTNGVHMASWDSPEADKLWTETCGKDRWLGSIETLEKNIRNIDLERIWEFKTSGKAFFIDYLRSRYQRQLATSGASPEAVEKAAEIFDSDVLTLGFARRFTSYKRPNLLLHNPERLHRILKNRHRPVQLIVAGKAHPGDQAGKKMIQEWVQFINSLGGNHNIVFLSDYDMLLTEQMVQGVDVWINTPKRPWEACGTSGMKVLVNGGINLSELDGWWDEAYSPELGWTFHVSDLHPEDPDVDAHEASRLYDLLEKEIIPEYYTRNEKGIPEKWVQRMRESMARLTPQYSSVRSLQQYTVNYYLPAANNFWERAADHGALAQQFIQWQHGFTEKWQGVRFTALSIEKENELWKFAVRIFLNNLLPGEVLVQLYAEESADHMKVVQPMEMDAGNLTDDGSILYTTTVNADRPAHEFTPRILPQKTGLEIPLECNFILWEH